LKGQGFLCFFGPWFLTGTFLFWAFYFQSRLTNKTMMLKKLTIYIVLAVLCPFFGMGQELVTLEGRVVDGMDRALQGVTIRLGGQIVGNTDVQGRFKVVTVLSAGKLGFSSVGYPVVELVFKGSGTGFKVVMEEKEASLKEVDFVSTGYQSLPRERATGSFAQPDPTVFKARVSSDVLSRLNAITSGLVFNANTGNTLKGQLDLGIRGKSTLFANDQPLIVVDNFPYSGDISALNPNDVESVTVLKDAAAASIWGAKAGNGVVVITTKMAKRGQSLKIAFNSNVTIGEKADLFYDPNVFGPNAYIEVEQFLFAKGKYNSALNNRTNYPAISPAVEVMALTRAGQLTKADSIATMDKLKGYDVRKGLLDHFYQGPINQQYALNLSAGGTSSAYYLSAGFDRGAAGLKYNSNKRTTLNFQSNFALLEKLVLNAGIYLSRSSSANDNTVASLTGNPSVNYAYNRLVDEQGKPLPVLRNFRKSFVDAAVAKGYLDWNYYPLSELGLNQNNTLGNDIRVNASLNYKLLSWLSVDLKYQLQWQQSENEYLQAAESYNVRNMVNQYAVLSGGNVYGYNIPKGEIRSLSNINLNSNNLRLQLNLAKQFGEHQLDALGGYEISQELSANNQSLYYGYRSEFGTALPVNQTTSFPLNPTGNGTIPSGLAAGGTDNRFRSVFVNLGYVYKQRYVFSASARTDGSNYFGVKTNQKTVPLWSTGLKWNVSKEPFYGLDWLPELGLSASYGYSGNLDRSVTGITTFQYLAGAAWSNLPYANLVNIGNPDVRWERASQLKFGVDVGSRAARLKLNFEYYFKRGEDLIGNEVLPISSGLYSYKGNFSGMEGQGFDLTINSRNLTGDLKWNTLLLISRATDRVTYYTVKNTALQYVNADGAAGKITVPIVGLPVHSLLSYKWAGLDPVNGDPRGYINGQLSKDYAALTAVDLEQLVYSGAARPTWFGGLSNSFSYKGFHLSATIGYKFGYFFRRGSINYTNLFGSFSGMNREYEKRWVKPGDELLTNVPSMVYPANANRDRYYNNAEIQVLKGDQIRLQDISLAYDLNIGRSKQMPRQLSLYLYGNNLGLIWTANREGLDPDFPRGIPVARSFSLGLKTNF